MASRSSPHRGDYRAVKKPKRHETTDRPADRPAAFAGRVLGQNVIGSRLTPEEREKAEDLLAARVPKPTAEEIESYRATITAKCSAR
jgi:hypothetical protein